jgi:hypothetical protein
MVHRTDVAGGIIGRASPANDRMCQRALSGSILESNPSPELASSLRRQAARQSPHGGSPAVPAIYLELLTG